MNTMTRIVKLVALVAALLLSARTPAADPPAKPALLQAETVIWAGLDYSQTRFYGTEDFKHPEELFPEILEAWNQRFLETLIQDKSEPLSKALGKRVQPDINAVSAGNRAARSSAIIRQNDIFCNESHLKEPDLAEAVRAYKMTSTNGLGLVFIMDRLVKSEKKGALYRVFFDVATREILAKDRLVVKAGGLTFRKYWFKVPRDAVKDLKKLL